MKKNKRRGKKRNRNSGNQQKNNIGKIRVNNEKSWVGKTTEQIMIVALILGFIIFCLEKLELNTIDRVNNSPDTVIEKLDALSFRVEIDRLIQDRPASEHNQIPVFKLFAKQGVYKFEIGRNKVPNIKEDLFLINSKYLCASEKLTEHCLTIRM